PSTVGVLYSSFGVFESSTWRPTGSTSSPWADKKSKPRMGLHTAARKKVTKNVCSPNERRRRNPTLGLICRRRLRAVGRLAAHSNDVEGHCTLRQYPP
ncbi:MAG: hypothetical protein ACK56I_17495, partial [bacterium]